MLSARKVPMACYSCRLQLLSLFEHGFTASLAVNASRARHSTRANLLRRNPYLSASAPLRRISSSRRQPQHTDKNNPSPEAIAFSQTESFVRQARQTFGETLPKDYLSPEEHLLYERLYGPPLRETNAEDLEHIPNGELDAQAADERARNVLLRELDDGRFEEVEFDPELGFSTMLEEGQEVSISGEPNDAEIEDLNQLAMGAPDEPASAVPEPMIQVPVENQREADVIARLRRDMESVKAQPVEEDEDIDEEFEEDDEEDLEEDQEEDPEEEEPDAYLSSDSTRTHPHTMIGRFGTFPSTLSLPKEALVQPISELLARADIKHLTEAAEKAFGGKGLPSSASTPTSKNNSPQKHIGLEAGQHKMSDIEADAYLAGVMPGTYAAVMSTLVEVRKRLGSTWIRELLLRGDGEGPRVLDAGAGGAGAIAWREVLQAEWQVLKEEGTVNGDMSPPGKTTVLTGPNTLRHRVSQFLDNTTFLPRLPDYIHASNSEELLDGAAAHGRKAYDIIVAPHTLLPLKEDFRRKAMVQNLWTLLDPNGGVLILIEKGIPRGFEAVAGARSLLLDSHISSPGQISVENEIQALDSDGARFTQKEEGMIIAPCTNHTTCPMYAIPGLTSGRKDFCRFGQRFLRPEFLQRVLGASARNHEDVKYSYIAVRRGVDSRQSEEHLLQGDAATNQSFAGYEEHDLPPSVEAQGSELPDKTHFDIKFHPLSLPRAILPPLKRHGHVTLDLCTPSGKLERWVVPKSFSKAAYRDARKSKWGDLWALGAKTRVLRKPRIGRTSEDGGKMKGVRDGKIGKSGKKAKKNQFDVIMGPRGFEGIEESRSQSRFVKPEKRTKRGRVWKPRKPITEEDLG